MTIRHSAAPWKFTENAGCKDIRRSAGGGLRSKRYAIAFTTGVGGGDDGEREDRANAAIIEAAPDMLRALREFAAFDCAGIDQEPDDDRMCGKCSVCEANRLLKRIEARARVPRRYLANP